MPASAACKRGPESPLRYFHPIGALAEKEQRVDGADSNGYGAYLGADTRPIQKTAAFGAGPALGDGRRVVAA